MCFFSITINIIQNKVFPSRLSLSPHPGTTPLIVGTTEINWNFPVAQMVKNLPAKQDAGSVPGSGRSTGEGNGNLLQYSCLENPMHRGAWWATQSIGSQSHDWAINTHTHTHTHTQISYMWLCLQGKKLPVFYSLKFLQYKTYLAKGFFR